MPNSQKIMEMKKMNLLMKKIFNSHPSHVSQIKETRFSVATEASALKASAYVETHGKEILVRKKQVNLFLILSFLIICIEDDLRFSEVVTGVFVISSIPVGFALSIIAGKVFRMVRK